MEKSDIATTRVITGYEVFRFGVPMIGEYDNAGARRRVTIIPAIAGAQYRITAWAFGNGNRSATPAVLNGTTEETSEFRHGTQETFHIRNTLAQFRVHIQILNNFVLANL